MYFIPKAPSLLFLAPSLAFAVVYVWSRRNKNVTMSFLGLFTFTAPYLPWVILGFGTPQPVSLSLLLASPLTRVRMSCRCGAGPEPDLRSSGSGRGPHLLLP
jgi:hypothetical protein